MQLVSVCDLDSRDPDDVVAVEDERDIASLLAGNTAFAHETADGLVAGGAQVTDELARECGMDAGFGRGATGWDVASYLVKTLRKMKNE